MRPLPTGWWGVRSPELSAKPRSLGKPWATCCLADLPRPRLSAEVPKTSGPFLWFCISRASTGTGRAGPAMQAPPAPPSVGKRAGALIAAGDLLEPEALSGTPGWGDVPAPLAPGADRRRRAWGREDAGGTGCAAQARTGRQVDEERGLMFLFSGAALASPGVRVSLGLSSYR